MTETPKRRGRKPTGTAMSNAERQRRYVARLKAQAVNPVTDANQGDTLALEIETQRAIIGTLNHQLEAAHHQIKTQTETAARELRTVTQDRDALEARLKAVSDELAQAIEREHAARREILLLTHERDQAQAAIATQQKAVSDAKQPTPPRGYPLDIKRLAVQLTDEGKPTAEIRAAILAAHGKAPDISNLARLVRSWRAAQRYPESSSTAKSILAVTLR